MVRYGIQLALDPQGNQVVAKTCTKADGPFICVICKKELSLRAGSKTPHHFIHRVKSSCEGNTDDHRVQADSLGTIGYTDDNQNSDMEPEPEEVSNDSIDQVLEELIPVESLVEPSSEEEGIQDPDVPDIEEEEPIVPDLEDDETTLAEDVSNEIITQALEMVDDIIKPHKCCQCKARGSDFHQMFTDETRERYGLNDLYVCSNPTCLVECPHCSMPNSQKRHKKTPMCILCQFDQAEFLEKAKEAVKHMEPIPEAPEWLTGRRSIFVLKMLKRRRSARIVYTFMTANKSRVPEFKVKWAEKIKAQKIAKQLMKVRKATEKTRKRNQQRREATMGTDGASRYKAMYSNKAQSCKSCSKQGKRRTMIKYESVMGLYGYSCKGCSVLCKGCNKPCIKQEIERFGDQCFPCHAWKSTQSDEWKTNQKGVLEAALKKQKWALGVLYLNAPGITKGRHIGDSLAHVPSGDIPSVLRRDHPEFSEIAKVILECRKM